MQFTLSAIDIDDAELLIRNFELPAKGDRGYEEETGLFQTEHVTVECGVVYL